MGGGVMGSIGTRHDDRPTSRSVSSAAFPGTYHVGMLTGMRSQYRTWVALSSSEESAKHRGRDTADQTGTMRRCELERTKMRAVANPPNYPQGDSNPCRRLEKPVS